MYLIKGSFVCREPWWFGERGGATPETVRGEGEQGKSTSGHLPSHVPTLILLMLHKNKDLVCVFISIVTH